MPDILLEGCTSRPLASCLKALGILRLVGEQQDAQCARRMAERLFRAVIVAGQRNFVRFFSACLAAHAAGLAVERRQRLLSRRQYGGALMP